eukprot:1392376-Amorphochlora_amoeboformis.AAC.1
MPVIAPWDKPAPVRRASVSSRTSSRRGSASAPFATSFNVPAPARRSISKEPRTSGINAPWSQNIDLKARGVKKVTQAREPLTVMGSKVPKSSSSANIKPGKKLIKPVYAEPKKGGKKQINPSFVEPKMGRKKMVKPTLRGDNCIWNNDPTLASWRPIGEYRRNSLRRGQTQTVNVLNPAVNSSSPAGKALPKPVGGNSLSHTSRK